MGGEAQDLLAVCLLEKLEFQDQQSEMKFGKSFLSLDQSEKRTSSTVDQQGEKQTRDLGRLTGEGKVPRKLFAIPPRKATYKSGGYQAPQPAVHLPAPQQGSPLDLPLASDLGLVKGRSRPRPACG